MYALIKKDVIKNLWEKMEVKKYKITVTSNPEQFITEGPFKELPTPRYTI